jgi:hypothetical protein
MFWLHVSPPPDFKESRFSVLLCMSVSRVAYWKRFPAIDIMYVMGIGTVNTARYFPTRLRNAETTGKRRNSLLSHLAFDVFHSSPLSRPIYIKLSLLLCMIPICALNLNDFSLVI